MVRIENIIVWILFILAVITSLWYIFGNSPSFEQAILTVAVAFLFTIALKVGGHDIRLNVIEKRFTRLEKSFIKLANDFKYHLIKHRDN